MHSTRSFNMLRSYSRSEKVTIVKKEEKKPMVAGNRQKEVSLRSMRKVREYYQEGIKKSIDKRLKATQQKLETLEIQLAGLEKITEAKESGELKEVNQSIEKLEGKLKYYLKKAKHLKVFGFGFYDFSEDYDSFEKREVAQCQLEEVGRKKGAIELDVLKNKNLSENLKNRIKHLREGMSALTNLRNLMMNKISNVEEQQRLDELDLRTIESIYHIQSSSKRKFMILITLMNIIGILYLKELNYIYREQFEAELNILNMNPEYEDDKKLSAQRKNLLKLGEIETDIEEELFPRSRRENYQKIKEELTRISDEYNVECCRLDAFRTELMQSWIDRVMSADNKFKISLLGTIPSIFKSFAEYTEREDKLLSERNTEKMQHRYFISEIKAKIDLLNKLAVEVPKRAAKKYIAMSKEIQQKFDSISDKPLSPEQFRAEFAKQDWDIDRLKAELDLIKQFKQTQALCEQYNKFTSSEEHKHNVGTMPKNLYKFLGESPSLKRLNKASLQLDRFVFQLKFSDKGPLSKDNFLQQHPEFIEVTYRAESINLIVEAELLLKRKGEEYEDEFKLWTDEMRDEWSAFFQQHHSPDYICRYIDKLMEDIKELHQKIMGRDKAKEREIIELSKLNDSLLHLYENMSYFLAPDDKRLEEYEERKKWNQQVDFLKRTLSLEKLQAYHETLLNKISILNRKLNQILISERNAAKERIARLNINPTGNKAVDSGLLMSGMNYNLFEKNMQRVSELEELLDACVKNGDYKKFAIYIERVEKFSRVIGIADGIIKRLVNLMPKEKEGDINGMVFYLKSRIVESDGHRLQAFIDLYNPAFFQKIAKELSISINGENYFFDRPLKGGGHERIAGFYKDEKGQAFLIKQDDPGTCVLEGSADFVRSQLPPGKDKVINFASTACVTKADGTQVVASIQPLVKNSKPWDEIIFGEKRTPNLPISKEKLSHATLEAHLTSLSHSLKSDLAAAIYGSSLAGDESIHTGQFMAVYADNDPDKKGEIQHLVRIDLGARERFALKRIHTDDVKCQTSKAYRESTLQWGKNYMDFLIENPDIRAKYLQLCRQPVDEKKTVEEDIVSFRKAMNQIPENKKQEALWEVYTVYAKDFKDAKKVSKNCSVETMQNEIESAIKNCVSARVASLQKDAVKKITELMEKFKKYFNCNTVIINSVLLNNGKIHPNDVKNAIDEMKKIYNHLDSKGQEHKDRYHEVLAHLYAAVELSEIENKAEFLQDIESMQPARVVKHDSNEMKSMAPHSRLFKPTAPTTGVTSSTSSGLSYLSLLQNGFCGLTPK